MINISNKPWPLMVSQFSFLDKLKIAKFVLTNDRWTQGQQIEQLEYKLAKLTKHSYTTITSSGSTANTIYASYIKDCTPIRKAIFPSTTWQTAISPFIREGIQPIFVDINLDNFGLDLDKVEQLLKHDQTIGLICVTALLGYIPDLQRLRQIKTKYNVEIFIDACEATLSMFEIPFEFTASTSMYFGHMITSIEGGALFTNNEDIYNYALMARNHGMCRSLPSSSRIHYNNAEVDPQFDFAVLGNNYRNTDLNAFIGQLDLNRAQVYTSHRIAIYNYYTSKLDKDKFVMPRLIRGSVPFCLPIIYKQLTNLRNKLDKEGIEYRPIISGNLLRQTCYKEYGDYNDYPNSELLHQSGIYVGLHNKVTKDMIDKLFSLLSRNL